MVSKGLDLESIQQRLADFAAVRDWGQFHSPKNLAMALAGEAGELLEVFQWLTEDQSKSLSEADLQRAAEELADIQIYLIRLAHVLDVDLPTAVEDKISLNEEKYPVELSKGDATKASRRAE
ncbi:MAG: nucleotide pyrophosphohydrolase [Actinomycetota bacterium]